MASPSNTNLELTVRSHAGADTDNTAIRDTTNHQPSARKFHDIKGSLLKAMFKAWHEVKRDLEVEGKICVLVEKMMTDQEKHLEDLIDIRCHLHNHPPRTMCLRRHLAAAKAKCESTIQRYREMMRILTQTAEKIHADSE